MKNFFFLLFFFLAAIGAALSQYSGSAVPVSITQTTTWVPADASGAGLSFTVTDARYYRIDKLCILQFSIVWPVTASGASTGVSGIPGECRAFNGTNSVSGGGASFTDNTVASLSILVGNNAVSFNLFNATTGAAITNANMSTKQVRGTISIITN